MSSNGWGSKTIEECSEVIFSGGTPSTKNSDFWNGNINWLSSGETSHDFIYETERHITQEGVANSSTKLAHVNDVVVASAGQGNTRGQASLCKIDTYINQSLIAIRTDKEQLDPFFLFYNIKNRYPELRKISDGSSIRGSLTTRDLKQLSIILPPLVEQKAIAHVLSTLDDKIEVNNRINKTLEDMAQAIFRRWFVDFEFPNEDGESYKSSGGEMVESELGMIPKGWRVGTVSDISAEIITGKTPNTKEKANFNGDIPFVKIPDMHGNPFIIKTESKLSSSGAVKNKEIPPNSIMVSCIATPGLVSIASKTCQTNQQINSIIPCNENFQYYIYFLMKELADHIKMLGSTGSATLNLNKNQFSKIKVIIPSTKMRDAYHKISAPLFEGLLVNMEINEEITIIRNSLLPKLMSGEIRVPIEES